MKRGTDTVKLLRKKEGNVNEALTQETFGLEISAGSLSSDAPQAFKTGALERGKCFAQRRDSPCNSRLGHTSLLVKVHFIPEDVTSS